MIEVAVSVSIAALSGLGVLMSRLHGRIHDLDNRIDGVELRVAEKYVPRSELTTALARFEDHRVRIENKLDNLAPALNTR